MSVDHLYVFFGEKKVYSSLLTTFLSRVMLSFEFFLYVLDTNPLSDIWFANIFSHSVGKTFILWIASFTVWKLFNLMQLPLLIFSFVSLA